VTDRKDDQRPALHAERVAAIEQMVTGFAHESRNALQQIQACSQLLKWELDGDEKKKELITDLQRAEERLLRLFEELRGYAAPMKLDRKPCDIRNVIADAWSAIEQQRDGRDVAFCDNASDLSTRCVADPLKLEQVFRNLFENAVFACDDPVRIEVTYETLDGDFLRITISDNGPGLTAEQQSRIFEPFFTTNTQGTGLGMAIVKRIVDAHSGQIRAESNGTNGAAMVVTLPSGLSPSWRTPREDNQRARAT
jgi:signal transduction histidine kinase